MYLLSSALMRIALRKRDFIDLCKCAIKMRYRHILTFLFDAYYQFWKQEIFDELIRYTTLANAYEMYGVLDECIDKINSIFDRAESS
jgi:hypothetical protein